MKYFLALMPMLQSSLTFAACGGLDRDACESWERVQSCDTTLVESPGNCVAPMNPPNGLVIAEGPTRPSPPSSLSIAPLPLPSEEFGGWLDLANGDQLKIDRHYQLHYYVGGRREIPVVIYTYPPGVLCGQEIQLADTSLPMKLQGLLRVNRYANQLEFQGPVQDSRYPGGWNRNAWLAAVAIATTSPSLQRLPCGIPAEAAPPPPPQFAAQAEFGCVNAWRWVGTTYPSYSVLPTSCAVGASRSSWIIRGVAGQDVNATGYTDGNYLRLETNSSALPTAYIYIGSASNPANTNAEFRTGDLQYSTSKGVGGWLSGN